MPRYLQECLVEFGIMTVVPVVVFLLCWCDVRRRGPWRWPIIGVYCLFCWPWWLAISIAIETRPMGWLVVVLGSAVMLAGLVMLVWGALRRPEEEGPGFPVDVRSQRQDQSADGAEKP